ncbi:hypothetical protein BE08_02415 [Sorangium cellulosum]|uniref:PepSY domain-containing protein n=1 Tax=Sorangium cellulosum TaxID=56 RepID=A0A150P4K9_SORCE|nr:hypothetical protein BE08_02415 [Sorangium cellulosum]
MASLVIRITRRILRVTPTVTRNDAMRIAMDYCAGVGWPWRLPVYVEEGVLEYYLMTNADMKGANVNIRVSVTDGKIVAAAFARR